MTVEEKAGMYAAKTEADFGFDMHPKTASFQGFIDGYAEAMRWRDPKEELPEYYKKVEIKIKRDDVVDYVNASLLAEDDGSLFFGDYNFVIFIKLKDVIGWRPIENKNHFEGRIEEAGCDFCRDEQGYTIGNMYVCDKCGRQVP